MNNQDKKLELKVGAFVLLGLAVALVMIIHFGKLGEGLRSYYALTVEFPNASGLLKGSDVLYGGAQVGRVSDHPRITNNPQVLDASSGVVVKLKVYEDIPIPEGSKFVVGSSGLLGDRFVDIVPPETFDSTDLVRPGSVLAGTRMAGIDDITREGTELIRDLRLTVTSIDDAVRRLDQNLLKDSNMKAVESSLKNLDHATGKIAASSDRLGEVVDGAKQAMQGAEATMATAQTAAEEIRKVIADAGLAIESTRLLLDRGLRGEGVIGQLLQNREIADNLEALLDNLRRHGVLFYRDSHGQAEVPKTAPRAAPPSKRSGNPGR